MLDVGGGFLASVERDPTAEAIVDEGVRLNYEEFLDHILRLAGGLSHLGLEKGDHLVTVLQNNWQAAALHWACQISAIAITPLNWRAKADELDYVLADAEAKALVFQDISEEAAAGAGAARDLTRIGLADAPAGTISFQDLLAGEPAPAAPRATPEDISVMLYTSGTTGRGKGVPRSHAAERTATIAHVAQNRYRLGERTLGVMPIYHTMGVRSLLSTAAINGCFVCQPRFEAERALHLIEAEGITNLYLVPTLYHDLITHEHFPAIDISTVRKLGFAGAAMTGGLLRRLDEAFKPELFVNHYGSSEIYTFTVCDDAPAKPGSAGKAGLNQRIRVVQLDSTDPDNIAAPNQEGQIIASLTGEEAFEGYWKRPDADAKSLHQGWYFTGDIGYFDADGDLFVTGRVDDMIITGGENVLPAEIESLLSLHPSIAEVAVVGLPDERWGQRVTAFVKAGGPVDVAELDDYCRKSDLANFKRPREYVVVDEIPKSPVGKILRRTLRETGGASI